jgi:hypothetical protein
MAAMADETMTMAKIADMPAALSRSVPVRRGRDLAWIAADCHAAGDGCPWLIDQPCLGHQPRTTGCDRDTWVAVRR